MLPPRNPGRQPTKTSHPRIISLSQNQSTATYVNHRSNASEHHASTVESLTTHQTYVFTIGGSPATNVASKAIRHRDVESSRISPMIP